MPEIVNDKENHVMEQILDSQLLRRQLHLLIKWEKYGYKENTWVPEGDISAPGKVQESYWNHPRALQQIQNLAFQSIRSWNPGTLGMQDSRRGVMSQLFLTLFQSPGLQPEVSTIQTLRSIRHLSHEPQT